MELGNYQLQIFVSLVVILGAAFVALICDLLKGNNEQLRELAIELKVRREEEHKRFQMLMPHAAESSSMEHRVEHAAQPAARQVETATEAPQVETRKTHQHVMARAAGTAKASTKEKKRPISAEALAVMERGAQMASAMRTYRRPERTDKELVEAAASVSVPETRVVPEVELVPAAVSSSLVAAAAGDTPKPAANRDWGSLLKPRYTVSPVGSKEPGLLDAVVAATTSDASTQASEPILPSGFQDGYVLTRLVESRQPVSGLVVSIGASTSTETSSNSNASLPSNVRELIQSLLGPSDFAAQSGSEEFLLIFPGERGASAQRRLSQVAQQLWDFQLRSLGTMSILFSWGGVEVRSESIDEAIASATERMEETRRGRKVLSMDVPLKKAV
jgi:hypothetical protein